jgi:predicted nucleic acid-binding protein
MAAAAFSLALMHRHSVYDSTYCALAMEMGCELITADRLLVAKLSHDLPFIKHLSEIKL